VDAVDIRLVVQRRCDVCDGTGEVLSEDWAAYQAWADRRDQRCEPERFFLDVQRMDSVPAMKRECGACEGGWLGETIPLVELVDYVLERAPKTIVPPDELRSMAETVRRSITAAAQKSVGLADADDAGSWLRAVQEGAEALRSITELLTQGREL
jgi:hypothetical protein